MLNAHLKAETRPVAEKENLIFWLDYRVTVLTDRLFRIEKSPDGNFNDMATQAVWFRDLPVNSFKTEAVGEKLTVDTGAVKLLLKKNFEDSRILLDGKLLKICNDGNLHGTYRTLDAFDGKTFRYDNMHDKEGDKIDLGTGVCSKTGVAVLDDGDTLLLNGEGELVPREPAFDKYVFAYGKDYRAAVKAFYAIEGAAPMIPRYALGNWWSRYHAYTDKEYLKVLNRYEENEVPLSVATIDMDWHYSVNIDAEKGITASGRTAEEYSGSRYGGTYGWTGYSWNKNLFPDYKKFLKEIEEKNLKITLNLHPADGVRWWEDAYKEFAEAMHVDPASYKRVPFDISSTEFINNYFKILHKPYEADGVEFWWIDWQQGGTSGKKNLDPLWALNHYHYYDNALNHDVPMILSRYCGAGAHRYPLGFTGDTDISWEILDFLPAFTSTASNIGYTWWSHDIGGHHAGTHDDELYVRFLQYGVFNPINRLHCTSNPTVTKEPWFYLHGSEAIAKEWLRFRHKLVPYLYTAAYRTHAFGIALTEPMYYCYPEEKEAYTYKNQYLFGEQLLVAPITKRGDKKTGYGKVNVWLPEGKWTDIFTGGSYLGGKTVTMRRTIESIPVLAKEGAILPLAEKVTGNGCPLPETLKIKVFTGNGLYSLYEDKGKKKTFTDFVLQAKDGVMRLKIDIRGDKGVLPKNRALKVEFVNLDEGKITVERKAGKNTVKEITADMPTVLIEEIEVGDEITVTVNYLEKTRLELLKENALRELKCAEGDNERKRTAYLAIAESATEEAFIRAVKEGDLTDIVKEKILETV